MHADLLKHDISGALVGTAVWDVREDGLLLRNRVERNALEAISRLEQSGLQSDPTRFV
jgi:hypothetical protein